MTIERWQEFECPACGIDYDFHDEQRVLLDQSFRCPGCDQVFIAGPLFVVELAQDTSKKLYDDGFLAAVPIGTFAENR